MSISSGFEQYIKKDSIFHRLNPFSKLLIAIMFLFLIFTSSSIFINVLLIASLLVVYILSAPKIRSLLNLLIVLVVIFIVLLLVN
jgi:energy-coupling factor transport system permease protein